MKNRFGIRKMTVGTASVVVGSMMFLGLTSDASAAEATYKLGDRVFSDNNGNYVQDAGDTGIAGITVSIRDYAGNHIATTTTDANGNYSFSGLKNGTYVVNFSVPSGYSNDVANIGGEAVDSDGPVDVLVNINGADDFTVDQGYIPFNKPAATTEAPAQGGGTTTPAPTTPSTPAPAKGNLQIGDHVWWDANRNNLYDQGENPVAGLRVSLRDYAGNFVAETTTDANGNYVFSGLSDGQYIVNFHNPLDWSPVIANIDNNVSEAIDSDGPIDVIVNLQGASNFNVDQGYYGVGTPAPGGGGTDNPGTTNPGGGTDNPGTTNPGGGTDNPGTSNPGGGTDNPGTTTPGTDKPADNPTTTPGTDKPADNTVKTTEPAKTLVEDGSKVGKTELPDTGEATTNGAVASLLALAGTGALLASRRRA